MPGLFSPFKDFQTGQVLTEADLDGMQQWVINNAIPSVIDDVSADTTEHESMSSDLSALPTSLKEEIQQLRKGLALLGGVTPWTGIVGPTSVAPSLILTNKTGTTLNQGEVVALSGSDDVAVALVDTVSSYMVYVVAKETIANNDQGAFYPPGVIIPGVQVEGAVGRGHYIRKSATAKKVESTGVFSSTTGANAQPFGTLGIALTASASGTITAYFFGYPSSLGLPGPGYHEYFEIGTPATPGTSRARAYVKTAAHTERKWWQDAAGQEYAFPGILFRTVPGSFSNISTEFTILSGTVKAHTLNYGSSGVGLRLEHFGILQNNTGANRDFTMKVKLGGITLCTMLVAGIVANAAFRGVRMKCDIVMLLGGGSPSYHAHGDLWVASAGATGTSLTGVTPVQSTGASVGGLGAISTIVDQTLEITGQFSTNNAALGIFDNHVRAELL